MSHDNIPQPAKDLANTDPESINQTVSPTAVEDLRAGHGSWRETFRMAFDQARVQHKQRHTRQELGQDKTKALIVLVAMAVVLVLLFFGVFSRPNKPLHLPGESPHGQVSLGGKLIPGQQPGDGGSAVAPMLSANLHANDSIGMGQVTAEEVDQTSRTGHVAKPSPSGRPSTEVPDYALGRVDFSDPIAGKSRTSTVTPGSAPSAIQAADSTDLKKPSLVFVRARSDTNVALKPAVPETGGYRLVLPVGTRLLARLEAPVSTAVRSAVVAVIEYNYERDGEVIMPAGAKVLGRLTQASPSGDVAIEFSRVEMRDGTSVKLDALAMDLNFKPLKGYVSGKKTGTKFLVRSLTGLGTIASYLVGPQASNSAGLISTNALLRERLSDNIALAGQQQLNELAFNQNLVVTIPGNTRLYIVVEKPVSEPDTATSLARTTGPSNGSLNGGLPTLEELQQLMQLRREINELYTQSGPAAIPAQPQP